MKIVLLDGSPATPSRVGLLLNTIAAALEACGCQTEIVELQALKLPINNPAYHANPEKAPSPKVRQFVATIRAADGVVLGTPLYHGSYSGLLKLALDHLADDAFQGRAIGLVSNASGPRSSFQAASALAPVARSLKGEVLNRMVGTCKADYDERDGKFQIIEKEIIERIELFAKELTAKLRSTGSYL